MRLRRTVGRVGVCLLSGATALTFALPVATAQTLSPTMEPSPDAPSVVPSVPPPLLLGSVQPSPWAVAPPPLPYAQTPAPMGFAVDLRAPGPGRVPVLVESAGEPQSVAYQIPNAPRNHRTVELCVTPCTLYLPVGPSTLAASAPGLRTTALPVLVSDQPLHLVVQPVSRASRTAAIVMLSVGGGVVTLGLAFVLVGAAASSLDGFSYDHDSGAPLVTTGAVMAGLGAAGLIAGGVMMASSATHYDTVSARTSTGFQPRFALLPMPHGALARVGLEF